MLSTDLEKLESIAGEIRGCVSTVEAKRIWERLVVLQVCRSETEDRLYALIQLLEERQDWPHVYEMRYDRFMKWASAMEQRLLHKQRALLDDLVKRLSGPLRQEVEAKEKERDWLVTRGRELGEHWVDRRDEVLVKVGRVEDIWTRLVETRRSELVRLQQLPADLEGLNTSLAELTAWFGRVEATLNAPLTVASCDRRAVESKLAEHQELERCVEMKSATVSSVLNLCRSFDTSDNALAGDWMGNEIEDVKSAMQALERRWQGICHAAAGRNCALRSLWPEWAFVLDNCSVLDDALRSIEGSLPPSSSSSLTSSIETDQLSSQLESAIQQLHSASMRQQLDLINEKYCNMARDGRVDSAGELQQLVAATNAKWRQLSDRLSARLQTTRDYLSSVHHWQGLRDRLLVWFAHCEVQLQHVGNCSGADLPAAWQILNRLQEELESLENARADVRHLARPLIAGDQRLADIRAEFDDYLQTETDVLVKLAQTRLHAARREQEMVQAETNLNVASSSLSSSSSADEAVAMADSGVYSFAERDDSAVGIQMAGPPPPPMADDAEMITSTPLLNAAAPVEWPAQFCSAAAASPTISVTAPPPAPAPEPLPTLPAVCEQYSAADSRQRTYAEVAKLTPKSPGAPSPRPVASVKSDTQRQLELAVEEWRQRLARLERAIQTSGSESTAGADADANADANDLVSRP